MQRLTFDNTARGERYFTATILSHLLMVEGFSGLRALFRSQNMIPVEATSEDDIELVSEVDPLRDGAIVNDQIGRLFREYGRMAVPDLFLRWGEQILIIEAKFFTHPVTTDLQKQISAQMKALSLVKDFTAYASSDIQYAVLTVQEVRREVTWPANVRTLIWKNLITLLRHEFKDSGSSDISYCLDILESAEQRSTKEATPKSGESGRVPNIRTLIAELPDLLEQGIRYIGYTGGDRKFMQTTLADLKSRDHYKLSEYRSNANWIPIEHVVERYIHLKMASDKKVDA